MDTDSTSRSVRLPNFDGDKAHYALYNTRFSAYANMYGFAAAIQEVADVNLPERHDTPIDEDTATGKFQAKAKKQNAYAFCLLAFVFNFPPTVSSSISVPYRAGRFTSTTS